jgi:hypothetical protein
LAVVVTVAKGYDLGYIWKTQGEAAGRTAGGYYINAAQSPSPTPNPTAGHPRRPPGSATLPHSTMHSARESISDSTG